LGQPRGGYDAAPARPALLEAGTDFSLMDDDGHQFLRYAKDNHWGRVVAWLKNHKQG